MIKFILKRVLILDQFKKIVDETKTVREKTDESVLIEDFEGQLIERKLI